MITITCENTGRTYQVEPGTSLREVKQVVYPENHHHILAALVNNQLQDLQYLALAPLRVNFIDAGTMDGYSVYTRSLIFVLYKAVSRVFPRRALRAEYIISNGIFCRLILSVRSSFDEEILRADESRPRRSIPSAVLARGKTQYERKRSAQNRVLVTACAVKPNTLSQSSTCSCPTRRHWQATWTADV